MKYQTFYLVSQRNMIYFVHNKHVKDKVYLHKYTPYNYKIVTVKGREKEYGIWQISTYLKF